MTSLTPLANGFVSPHQGGCELELAGDRVQLEFVFVVSVDQLVADLVVRGFGIVVDGFNERRNGEVPQIGREDEFVEGFFERWCLVVDVNETDDEQDLGPVTDALVIAGFHVEVVLGHGFPVETVIAGSDGYDPGDGVQTEGSILGTEDLSVADFTA